MSDSEPVTKLQLMEVLDERFMQETIQITTTIKDAVNGNLKRAIQDFEIKAMARDADHMQLINEIRSSHSSAMNKMNLNMQKIAAATRQTVKQNTRLFQLTDDIKDNRIPALKADQDKEIKKINEHINQERGAGKLWFTLMGTVAAVGAVSGLIALLG